MIENQRSARKFMGSLIFPELSLDSPFSSKKPFLPGAIDKFLDEVSRICGVSGKISKLDDYVTRLQDEMHKIDAFKRELPLCMLLLSDAIVALKSKRTEYEKWEPEPVLEEFMPLKKNKDLGNVRSIKETDAANAKLDKTNWMDSVQLWNSTSQQNFPKPGSRTKERTLKLDACEKTAMEENDESGEVMGLSLCLPDIKNPREELTCLGLSPKSSGSRSGSVNLKSFSKAGHEQPATTRKKRRNWSPELHRRFVNALHQLGGAKAATPKQIREHMQVEGLTNDEVKSHLQKYRLHARKVDPTTSNVKPVGLGEKHRNSQSNSPQESLLLNGSSLSGGESMEDEED